MIRDRVSSFVAQPDAELFDELARAAFAYQYERVVPIRRLCQRRSLSPERLEHWSQVPLIPTSAFKSVELCAGEARETFLSSGTTAAERSVHYHPFPELYRQVIDASFPEFCLLGDSPPPMLSLIPTHRQLPESSLAFMVDHILRRYGGRDSVTAFSARGVETDTARQWLERRLDDGQGGWILGTALALFRLVESLKEQRWACRLPDGTAVFETGGFKGLRHELTRTELLSALERQLGLAEDVVVREYGMTELTSQAYSRVLFGGDPNLFFAPAWTRVRILDPASLEELPADNEGLLAIFDLANLGSAVHLLTEDLALADPGGGFRLRGRAAGAELRGCSLTADLASP